MLGLLCKSNGKFIQGEECLIQGMLVKENMHLNTAIFWTYGDIIIVPQLVVIS